jgi:hypothetical protein
VFDWLKHHPKQPPRAARIRELELKIRYFHHQKGYFTVTTATLNWSNPTTRTDGTALSATEIASIDVFDNGAQLANIVGAATTFQTKALAAGNHAFEVFVNDTTGNKSGPSNIATITVPSTAPPSAVTNLTAVLGP